MILSITRACEVLTTAAAELANLPLPTSFEIEQEIRFPRGPMTNDQIEALRLSIRLLDAAVHRFARACIECTNIAADSVSAGLKN